MKQKRPIEVVGDTVFVHLTRGYVAKVDIEDLDLVSGKNWFSVLRKTNGVEHHVYAETVVGNGTISMHRLIAGLGKGYGYHVDHIDCDGLNNKRCNLRIVTSSQNQMNQKRRLCNTSGYKGVSFHKPSGKYTARIRYEGKQINLGSFEDPKDAWEAYKTASRKYHGEFGRFE